MYQEENSLKNVLTKGDRLVLCGKSGIGKIFGCTITLGATGALTLDLRDIWETTEAGNIDSFGAGLLAAEPGPELAEFGTPVRRGVDVGAEAGVVAIYGWRWRFVPPSAVERCKIEASELAVVEFLRSDSVFELIPFV